MSQANRIIRGTTVEHVFNFSADPETFQEILITYKQGDRIVVEKRKEDLEFSFIDADSSVEEALVYSLTSSKMQATVEDKTLYISYGSGGPMRGYVGLCKLSQEETARFDPHLPIVKVNIRIKDENADVKATKIYRLSLWDVCNDEVI